MEDLNEIYFCEKCSKPIIDTVCECTKMRLKIDMDTKILLAIKRLETAQKYGSDMITSKELCINDAISLLTDATYLKGQGHE